MGEGRAAWKPGLHSFGFRLRPEVAVRLGSWPAPASRKVLDSERASGSAGRGLRDACFRGAGSLREGLSIPPRNRLAEETGKASKKMSKVGPASGRHLHSLGGGAKVRAGSEGISDWQVLGGGELRPNTGGGGWLGASVSPSRCPVCASLISSPQLCLGLPPSQP